MSEPGRPGSRGGPNTFPRCAVSDSPSEDPRPGLLESLRTADAAGRAAAARRLGSMKPLATDAVKSLVAALGDIDPEVREASCLALAGGGQAVVPDLIQAWHDAGEFGIETRRGLLVTFTVMGPEAIQARQLILDAVDIPHIGYLAGKALDRVRRLPALDRTAVFLAVQKGLPWVVGLLVVLGMCANSLRGLFANGAPGPLATKFAVTFAGLGAVFMGVLGYSFQGRTWGLFGTAVGAVGGAVIGLTISDKPVTLLEPLVRILGLP